MVGKVRVFRDGLVSKRRKEDTVTGVRMHIYGSTRAYIAIAGLGAAGHVL